MDRTTTVTSGLRTPIIVLMVLVPGILSQGLPTVTVTQTSYNIVQGNTVTLACTVSGATNIFWQKIAFNGQTTTLTIDNSNYGGSSVGAPSLVIFNIDSNDQATYVCNGQNTAGTTTGNQITLIVSSGAPILSTVQTSYSVSTGTTVTLSCSYSSSTSVSSVYWQVTKGGTTTAISTSSSRFSGATVSAPSLQISSTQTSDSGSYRCFAVNTLATGAGNPITLTVSGGSVPTVTAATTAYSSSTGSTIELSCSVSGSPAVTSVFWQKLNTNNVYTTLSIDGTNYGGSTTSNPNLLIYNTNSGDSGSYLCKATNSLGTSQSAAITVSVSGNVPSVSISQSSYTTTSGSTVTLICSVSGSPAVTNVFWQRNINGVTSTITIDNSKYGGSTTGSPSLVIYSAASSDNGLYRCFATNSVGTGQSAQTTFTVTGSVPTVSVSQTSYSVSSGTTVTLACSISANPVYSTVYWQRNIGSGTQTITIDNINFSGSTVSSPSLTVISASSSDSGSYRCFATNSVGTGQSGFTTLTVSGNLPAISISQSSYSVSTGTSITLSCSVSANPGHTSVYWQRNVGSGTQSVSIDNVNFSGATVSSPSLTVITADTNDAGTYTCYAVNSVGTGQSGTITLSVTGNVPSVSISQSAYSVTSGTSITLSCSVSSNPGHTSVFWQRIVGSGTQSISIDNTNFSGATVSSPSLTVISADSGDSGTYRCFATNAIGTGQSSAITLSVSGSVPAVSVVQSSYSINSGSSITLGCSVSGNPSITSVFWQRNVGSGTQSVSVDNVNFSGATVSSPSLTVITASSGDAGSYTCFATNSVGTGQSTTTLSVSGNVPTVSIAQSFYSVTTGTTVTLTCSVSASPTHTTVYWQRNIGSGSQSVTIDNVNFSGATVSSPSLTVISADSSDSGSYTCFATNSVGTGQSGTTTLTVSGNVPSVAISQSSYSVSTGTSITLSCSVSATPSHTSVFWQRNVGSGVQSITIDNVNFSGATVSSPSLTVITADASDSGSYTCFAVNSVGTGQSGSTTLSVTGSVPTVIASPTSYTVTTGNNAVLQCSVSANPAVTNVFWQKLLNNVYTTLTMGTGAYSGSTTSSPTLTVLSANSDDAGSYLCKASNSVGTGQSSVVTLTVSGSVPSLTVTQSSYSITTGNSVTLQCSVSANPTITSVYWQRIQNGATAGVTVDGVNFSGATTSNPSLTVITANPGDSGTYTCFAINSVGTGQSSQISLTVTGNLPVVTIGQTTYSVNTNSVVTLQCSVSANPAITSVVWQRSTGGTTSSIAIDGSKYSGGSTTSPTLVINNVASTDSGTYVCQATNSIGTGIGTSITLSVTGSVPAVTIPQTSYSVVRGSSITIPCTVSSSPSATSIVWERIINGAASTLTIDGTKWSGGSLSVPSLTISNSATSDQAYYVCKATNSVGTGQSSQSYLTVTGSVPVATISQSQYTVVQGVSKTIDCTVSASPAANSVSWERINGGVTTTLTMDGTKFSGGQLSTPSLTIISAASSDQGYYVCTAMNSVGIGRSSQAYLTVTGSAPTVTIGSSTYTVVIGNTITLGCTFTSSPSATSLKWEKFVNGVASTITIDGTKYGGGSLSSPDLTINTAASSDQLYYKCSVSNSVGEGSSSQTYLYVTGNIPSVSVSQTSYSIGYGSSVTLNCAVTSTPAASSVFWEHTDSNGVTSTVTIGSGYQGSTLSSPSLVISSAALADQGSYYCKATNNVGTGTSSQVYLYVTGDTPNLTVGAATYSVPIGGSATLGCTITSSPAATSIFWSKVTNGASSTISTAGNSRYSGGTLSSPSLVITSLQSSDAGSYRCNAVNSVGTGQSSLTSLIATYAPQNTVVSPSSLTRDEGQTISATCTSDASPNPTFAWVKVSTNQQYGTSNTLTISSIDRGHDGDYRCTATNSQGSDTATMTVNVRYRPVSTVTSAQASVVLSSGQSQTLQCNTVSNPSVSSYSWTKDGVSLTSATSQNYIVTISASSDYGTYSCFATNAVGQSNAIPFAVSSGTTGTTSGPATGASTADTGLTSGTIAAIILAILFILLILLLVICCCCMKGVCGKKEKKKRKIEPTVIREEPKEIIRTIEIPRYVEKPVVYREPAYREPAYREPVYRETYREPSAVSRQDVVIAEENFDILKYQTVPPSGTSIDDSLEHNHRRSFRAPANLPALEYTVEATTTADDEERRRRRRSKKRRRRHREEGEGEEREHRSTSRRRHRRKRHEEVEGEPIITNGDVYYRNYSNNADTSEQYYYN